MSFTRPIGVAFTDQDLDDATLGASPSAGGKVGFYGTTPITQRAAAIQAASVVSATSWASVVSNQAAFNAEVAATLAALGLWKGAA
jgi:hypothetical protein